MAINTFSIGRDAQLVVVGPRGRLDLSYVSGFESHQLTQSIRVSRLDGVQMGTELPKGWEGSFEMERGSAAVEDFIAAAEQEYFDGNLTGTSTMYQYIAETDGSISTYQFDGTTFRLASAGHWKGDSSVKQKLEFFSARRRRI
jgi:hypothetical protein